MALVIDVNILGQKVKVRYQEEDIIEWLSIDQFKRV